MMNRLAAFLMASLLSAGMPAQRFYFERLDVQNGLPTSNVYAVLQDSTGLVWLGTEDGLVSFDGRDRVGLQTFGPDEGLAPKGARQLMLDREGRLWVGHSGGGLSLRMGQRFIALRLGEGAITADITGLEQDADGTYWITTMGQGVLHVSAVATDGLLTVQRYGGNEGLVDHLLDVRRLRDGTIAFLEDGGTLKKWDPTAKRFSSLEWSGLQDVLGVNAVFEDGDGRLWLGTISSGAFCRDPRTGQVVNYNVSNGLPSNLVSCFGEDAAGQVWVGTWGGGAAVIGLNGVRRHYHPANGLESLLIRRITRDREGNMLLATGDYGLQIFKGERFLNLLEQDGLLDQQVWAVMEDRSGRLWFGTDGGISILDPKVQGTGMVKTLQTVKTTRVRSIVEDARGNVWVGSETNGIMELEPNSFQQIPHPDLDILIPRGKVTALAVGQPGELWIGTVTGLRRYSAGAPPMVYGDDDGVPTTPVTALFRDDKGTIWVGSKDKGITRIDNGKATPVALDRALSPSCFVQDTEGRLWVGSRSQGVFVLKNGKQEHVYSKEDGLLDNTIRSLMRDEDGNIWIGTVSGLNSWRPGQEGFLAYTERSGFIGVEAKPNAVCLARKGDLWFGTARGATRVVPEKSGVAALPPLVALRGLNINLEDRPLEQDLRLGHSERSIRIYYGTVSLSDPGAVRYAYMLEGLDKAWQPLTTETDAYYPALPPGSYTFKVKSMNRAGLWSEKPAELEFAILPPWWQSWWFYTALALVIAISVVSWIKFRERQLRLRNQVLERKVAERTAEVVAQSREIEGQKVRIEDLLLNILPKEISEELKDKGKATARRHDAVTVMFTDMKGFTKAAEKMTPEELVSELDECFIKFDEIIGRYGIEKIKTIGDSYMCASGVPSSVPNHATRSVMAALEVREMMDSWRKEHEANGKEPWILRIGLHSGPVVAGVVGKRKFAYDIWGDAVNTASRMESSGEPGEVNVSGATHALIKDHFVCEHRGQVEAKNKGKIDMYFVKRIKPEYSADDRGLVPNARFRKECGLPEPVQELA
jgi:ligand-binding sensor domain-containing protein/class 3 adenylate cyclase